ncbi:Uncharacterized protein PRO82_001509 [Candidatus Protochlamydia amoebophila]|nr:Uncharacterized protein [Candidatus Protochlamydia amoebophila]
MLLSAGCYSGLDISLLQRKNLKLILSKALKKVGLRSSSNDEKTLQI